MEEYDSSQGLSSSDLKHGSKIDEFRSSIHNLELQLAKTKEDKAGNYRRTIKSKTDRR